MAAASKLLARFLPGSLLDERSIYETLRGTDDIEAGSIPRPTARRRSSPFRDTSLDLDNLPLHAGESPTFRSNHRAAKRSTSRVDLSVPAGSHGENSVQSDATESSFQDQPIVQGGHEGQRSKSAPEGDDDRSDDDVPPSLLVGNTRTPPSEMRGSSQARKALSPQTVPSASIHARYLETSARPVQATSRQDMELARAPLQFSDQRERAAWMWANVENLDHFLLNVYDYYTGHGIWSILLKRAINLLTMAFVVGFSTFLTSCVEYRKIPGSRTLPDIVVPNCSKQISGLRALLLWLFLLFWFYKAFDLVRDFRRLRFMQSFYLHLLGISDSDIQTISWPEIVKMIMDLRHLNSVTIEQTGSAHRDLLGVRPKERLSAHDIANRIMRRDNYFIAIINREILDFSLPFPFWRNRRFFSRSLEWNLQYCILDFIFDDQGHVRPLFLKDSHRRALVQGLRNRFLFAGCLSFCCAPFTVVYYFLTFFFQYFTEFQRNPSQISSRQYTPYAEWKFREFNELQHLFLRRLNLSYPHASNYINQFPKDKTVQFSAFIAFVAGALASVLAVASLLDPESFLSFELTPDRTVLFYLGIFGTVWAIAKGNMTEDNSTFEPESALHNVANHTHFLPARWQGRLHTNAVRAEFAQLYQTKICIFLEEILSIILAPFILWFSLPKSCERIIDFFREFTIHVDGMGHLCSFAVFDFQKTDRDEGKAGQDIAHHPQRESHHELRDDKMIASFYGFLDTYETPSSSTMRYTNHKSQKRSLGNRPLANRHATRFQQPRNQLDRRKSSGRPSPQHRAPDPSLSQEMEERLATEVHGSSMADQKRLPRVEERNERMPMASLEDHELGVETGSAGNASLDASHEETEGSLSDNEDHIPSKPHHELDGSGSVSPRHHATQPTTPGQADSQNEQAGFRST